MQVEKTLKFNQAFNQDTPITDAIPILKYFLEQNMYDIHDLLFSYHYAKRESVYDINIDEKHISYNNNKGFFIVNYMIGISNACADLNFNDTAKMKIRFAIDFKKDTVLLTGECIPDEEQHEI